MRGLLGLARSGVSAVLLHRARSLATVACVVALLLPLLAGLAVFEGLRDQAADGARFGADLVVTGRRYGRPAPLPASAADVLRAIPGVASVEARIVGSVALGSAGEPAVVVGVDAAGLPDGARCVEGRLFAADGGNELVVGSRLARRLGLGPGAAIPPFYRSREGERVSTVVGVFRSDLPVWEANLVFTSLETARRIFDERETVTDLLVTCDPGYADEVRRRIARLPSLAATGDGAPLFPRVLSRADRAALLAGQTASGTGIFGVHWLLLLAAGVPLVIVTSGAGLRDRRRETGVLKMLGWGTDEVLVRVFVESLVLAAAAASAAVLLAALWLGPLGARGLAAALLPGADADPAFAVPWRLAPAPVAVASALALALVLLGTLPSNWRAAAAEPMESMR